jgi:Protein of unknown function (DUF1566)
MEKNNIFNLLTIFIILMVSFGCDDYKTRSTRPEFTYEHFSTYIKYPVFQEVYTEGYPKDFKAEAFLGEKELTRNVTFIWSSNIDGDIDEGNVTSTEHLSIGEHLITVNAYYKTGKTASDTIKIKKVSGPSRIDVEQEQPSRRMVTDRIDGTVYIDNRDGTVTDTITNLMWEQSDDGFRRNVYDAHQYCEKLELAGHNDWHMPTLSEIEEIANIGRHKKEPIICQVFDTKNSSYWTQTLSRLPSYPDRNFYSCVNFIYNRKQNGLSGKIYRTADENTQRYVRCVR